MDPNFQEKISETKIVKNMESKSVKIDKKKVFEGKKEKKKKNGCC